MKALEEGGHVFALPIVQRVQRLWRLIAAVGWAAAKEMGTGEWRGWEADFLRGAIVAMDAADRNATILEQASVWRSHFGARPLSDE